MSDFTSALQSCTSTAITTKKRRKILHVLTCISKWLVFELVILLLRFLSLCLFSLSQRYVLCLCTCSQPRFTSFPAVLFTHPADACFLPSRLSAIGVFSRITSVWICGGALVKPTWPTVIELCFNVYHAISFYPRTKYREDSQQGSSILSLLTIQWSNETVCHKEEKTKRREKGF